MGKAKEITFELAEAIKGHTKHVKIRETPCSLPECQSKKFSLMKNLGHQQQHTSC